MPTQQKHTRTNTHAKTQTRQRQYVNMATTKQNEDDLAKRLAFLKHAVRFYDAGVRKWEFMILHNSSSGAYIGMPEALESDEANLAKYKACAQAARAKLNEIL